MYKREIESELSSINKQIPWWNTARGLKVIYIMSCHNVDKAVEVA